MSWWHRAACRGVTSPSEWHPDERGAGSAARYRSLRVLCESCRVRVECLNAALEVETDRERFGMWGGMTPSERERYRSMVLDARRRRSA